MKRGIYWEGWTVFFVVKVGLKPILGEAQTDTWIHCLNSRDIEKNGGREVSKGEENWWVYSFVKRDTSN